MAFADAQEGLSFSDQRRPLPSAARDIIPA